MRVLAAGELNVDLVLSGCDSFPELGREVLAAGMSLTLGSSSAICAAALATLGVPVTFVGRAGCDLWGDLAVSRLHELGVDTAPVIRDANVPTGITVSISSALDRAMVTYLGSIAALTADDIEVERFARAGVTHLHVSSYYLQRGLRPGLRRLFAAAHGAGMTTSLDPGCDPEGKWDRYGILDVLREVDIFFPNAGELRAIAGVEDETEALRRLSTARMVAAKLGPQGAVVFSGGGITRQEALPVEPVDTTGAGDAFNAGFLASWLRDHDTSQALLWGAACGALSTRGVGGTAALPSSGEVDAFLRRA
ncbi:MAG: carbohydrate kinase family protein [Bryobacterales bacterium]|nr:carbohydrate kinase family protein [Bryobacterales bacterium]